MHGTEMKYHYTKPLLLAEVHIHTHTHAEHSKKTRYKKNTHTKNGFLRVRLCGPYVVCESVKAKTVLYKFGVSDRVDNDKDENKHPRIIPSFSL